MTGLSNFEYQPHTHLLKWNKTQYLQIYVFSSGSFLGRMWEGDGATRIFWPPEKKSDSCVEFRSISEIRKGIDVVSLIRFYRNQSHIMKTLLMYHIYWSQWWPKDRHIYLLMCAGKGGWSTLIIPRGSTHPLWISEEYCITPQIFTSPKSVDISVR